VLRCAVQECVAPSLLRFRGRPDDLSPLARLRSWLGGPLPFDRHDWWVDRCGEEVRYVIDFYFDEEKAGGADAFQVVVRPALDSPTAALDRVKMQIYLKFAEYGLPCPITGHRSGDRGSMASGGVQ
jgi:cytochrome c heme-lyase